MISELLLVALVILSPIVYAVYILYKVWRELDISDITFLDDDDV